MRFLDRADAGRQLARRLTQLRGTDVVVLGLPRGGVPVAFEVAKALDAELDVIMVRKLGVQFQPELAAGAIGEGGVVVLDDRIMRTTGMSKSDVAALERPERAELLRRAARFRGEGAPPRLAGRTAVIVDDGIATGSTARAACQVARAHGARRVVLAVPVGSPQAIDALAREVDELVFLAAPPRFDAVGQWYSDFDQVSDDEVVELLRRARADRGAAATPPAHRFTSDEEVVVGLVGGRLRLPGRLTVPYDAKGVVVFAHGSGSSARSPRNRMVAAELTKAGMATLLFDLLTEREALDRAAVFDIELLAARLTAATAWVRTRVACEGLPVGYFGASTGAAAALWAAADPAAEVAAVVSRGGRPDLAAARLADVRASTLLIVGGDDPTVLDLNRRAAALLHCSHRLIVVPGATHLFEEPGALAQVARIAAAWFTAHLVEPDPPTVAPE